MQLSQEGSGAMGIKPRTIDDLGIEASKQYAQNKQELEGEVRLIEESRFFPAAMEPGVMIPYVPVSFEEGFTVAPFSTWASFSLPPNFAMSSARLFTYQFIPSIGSSERMQALNDQFDEIGKTLPADAKVQYEYKTISSLLVLLLRLVRTFELIRARKNQYQRG